MKAITLTPHSSPQHGEKEETQEEESIIPSPQREEVEKLVDEEIVLEHADGGPNTIPSEALLTTQGDVDMSFMAEPSEGGTLQSDSPSQRATPEVEDALLDLKREEQMAKCFVMKRYASVPLTEKHIKQSTFYIYYCSNRGT